MRVRLRDLTLAYVDRGKGPPVLLIHGYPLNNRLWEPQFNSLTNNARLLAPDLRGFGESEVVPGPYSMDLLAKDCHDLLERIVVRRPVVVAGLSMGGYIAFAFYRNYPAKVSGLVLAATRAGPDSQEAKAQRDKAIELVQEKGVSAIAESMIYKMMSPKTYEENPELVAFVRRMMESNSVEGITGALQAMKGRPDSSPTLGQIAKPTLILHGVDDQLIPIKEAEMMRDQIITSQLMAIPNAGHLLNLEQPGLFNGAISDFVKSL